MSLLTRIVAIATLALGTTFSAFAQEGSFTISVTFGPDAEIPDPRSGHNGWMSNQTGVTETLMGIDYELNLYPRLAKDIEQVSPTTWRVTLPEGLLFHDGTPVTAQTVVESISAISDEDHPGYNARLHKALDLADMGADSMQTIIFETNSANAAFPWTLSDLSLIHI